MGTSSWGNHQALVLIDPATDLPYRAGDLTVGSLAIDLSNIGTSTGSNPPVAYTTLFATPGTGSSLIGLTKSLVLGLGDPGLSPIPNTTLLATPGTTATALQLLKAIQLNTTPAAASTNLPPGYVVGTATAAGAGYTVDDQVLFFFSDQGAVLRALNLTTGTILGASPATTNFDFTPGGIATSTPVELATYVLTGGTAQTGFVRDGKLYPTRADAIADSNEIAIGTGAGQGQLSGVSSGSQAIELVSYTVDGTTVLTGFVADGKLYPTRADAVGDTNELVIGTGATEAQLVSGGAASSTPQPQLINYTLNGVTQTGFTLNGALYPARADALAGTNEITVGTGAGEAQLISNTATETPQLVSYTLNGATLTGFALNGFLYATRADALATANAITIGTAAGEAQLSTATPAVEAPDLVSYVRNGVTQTGFELSGVLYATLADALAATNPLTIGTAAGESQLSTATGTVDVYVETYRLTSKIAAAAAATPERLAVTGGPTAAEGDPGNTLTLTAPETIRAVSIAEMAGAQFGGILFTGLTATGLAYVLGGGNDFSNALPQVELDPSERLLQSLQYETSFGVEGTGVAGAAIEVFANAVSIGTTTVGTDGIWRLRERGHLIDDESLITATEGAVATTNFEIKHAEVEINVMRSV